MTLGGGEPCEPFDMEGWLEDVSDTLHGRRSLDDDGTARSGFEDGEYIEGFDDIVI